MCLRKSKGFSVHNYASFAIRHVNGKSFTSCGEKEKQLLKNQNAESGPLFQDRQLLDQDMVGEAPLGLHSPECFFQVCIDAEGWLAGAANWCQKFPERRALRPPGFIQRPRRCARRRRTPKIPRRLRTAARLRRRQPSNRPHSMDLQGCPPV